MITGPKKQKVEELVAVFSKEELIWLNGYISGFVAGNNEPAAINGNNGIADNKVKKITIVYATETGNCKKLAGEFTTKAKKGGVQVKLSSLDQYKLKDLEKEAYFFIIISTHGDGEPPEMAKKFFNYIHQDDRLKLTNLKYGVLALGDTAYPLYCKAGEDVDARLETLGGKRILVLKKCDLDYEDAAGEWIENVLQVLDEQIEGKKETKVYVSENKQSGRKFYSGKISSSVNLNDKGSNKETYHIELVTDEEVDYQPGDSLAVVPRNRREIVDSILELTGADGGERVETGKYAGTIEDLLLNRLNVCYLLSSTLRKYAVITGQVIPDTRMDLKDLLRIYPLNDKKQFPEVLKILNPLAPRLYSISSSPKVQEGEVHITVGKCKFFIEGEERYGLCSSFLGELQQGELIRFYIHKNRAFKLPPPEKDIIMVGPGTGIASCRSFLAERDAIGASGRNWLFFGEQHFVSDFLYQTEIQTYKETGVLNKVSLAFSRDQEEKIYVQYRMKENENELREWIQAGAYFYVCGSKIMGRDVEMTLIEIIGEDVFIKLKEEGRYQKDVY